MKNRYEKAAQVRGDARSAEVVLKVQKAMNMILDEINTNDGIYPANGGAVSKNEVARRAGISLTTLFSPKQKELGQQVSLWLDTLKKKETIGRRKVRRSYVERAEDWKARYRALECSHRKTELDLQRAQAERDQAIIEAQRLHDENVALLEQLRFVAASNITPLMKGHPVMSK